MECTNEILKLQSQIEVQYARLKSAIQLDVQFSEAKEIKQKINALEAELHAIENQALAPELIK